MPFRPRLDEEAAKALIAFPRAVRLHVAAEIRRLAADPTALSRPAAFPHALDGQLFDTNYTDDEFEYFITIMFRYHPDEIHLDVAWITHIKRPTSGSGFEDDDE